MDNFDLIPSYPADFQCYECGEANISWLTTVFGATKSDRHREALPRWCQRFLGEHTASPG